MYLVISGYIGVDTRVVVKVAVQEVNDHVVFCKSWP